MSFMCISASKGWLNMNFFLFFVFLGPYLWHMEVPRLGVKSELQLLAYTTVTASLMHFTMLHGIPCMQLCCIESTTFKSDAFTLPDAHPLYSMTLHGIDCINWDAVYRAAGNPLHSLGIHLAMRHVRHCV